MSVNTPCSNVPTLLSRCRVGYPGDGINGVFGALNRARDKIEFIQARHEEMAAFMASAYAKFSGELGVCIATSGPGAARLVTGMYDARADHQPLLAIVGQQARGALGFRSRAFPRKPGELMVDRAANAKDWRNRNRDGSPRDPPFERK